MLYPLSYGGEADIVRPSGFFVYSLVSIAVLGGLMISTIIPCFNAVETLERAVNSCLIQPEVNEIIVVDDGSTDGSRELAERLSASNARVKALRMTVNSGPAAARNFGVLYGACPIMSFLDADDEYREGALSVAYAALSEHNQLSAVKLPCEFVGCPDKYRQHESFAEVCQTLGNTFAGNLVIRREVLFALGLFPQSPIYRQHGGEDAVLMLGLSQNFQIGVLEQEQACVRVHFHANSHSQLYFERCIKQVDDPAFIDDKDEVWHHSMKDVNQVNGLIALLGRNISSSEKGFVPIWKNN